MDPSVLVEGDAFFRFLRNGVIKPWLPAAHAQNTTVTRASGAAAGAFAKGGLHTVYDGIVGPWFLDEFLSATGLPDLDYVVLLPPADICADRVKSRTNHGFKDEAAARQMHDQFDRHPVAERHIVRDYEASPAALAQQVLDAISKGDHRYGMA